MYNQGAVNFANQSGVTGLVVVCLAMLCRPRLDVPAADTG
jgi:hypothetical protein